MSQFTLEKTMDNSAVYVNKDALQMLEQSWDEIEKDCHILERSTWLMQVVMIRDKKAPSIPKQEMEQLAMTNAQFLSEPRTWSCVKYSYSPDEMFFLVFIHEAEQNPIYRENIMHQCKEKVKEAGWRTLVLPLLNHKDGYAFGIVNLMSVEGRYKTALGYYNQLI